MKLKVPCVFATVADYAHSQGRIVADSSAQIWMLCTALTAQQARGAYRCNSGVTVMGTTDCFLKLDLKTTPQFRIHDWFYKQTKTTKHG